MQNQQEDILKRFLQDTFSDYEPEPEPQTWEHIRTAIQPQNPKTGGGLKRWALPVVSLLFFVGGLIYVLNQNEEKPLEIAMKMESPDVDIVQREKGKELIDKVLSPVVGVPIDYFGASTTVKDSKIGTNSIRPSDYKILLVNKTTSDEDNLSESGLKDEKINRMNILKSSNLVNLDSDKIKILKSSNPLNLDSDKFFIVVGVPADHVEANNLSESGLKDEKISNINTLKSSNSVNLDSDKINILKSSNPVNLDSDKLPPVVGVPTAHLEENEQPHQAFNNAIVQEVRYVKPLDLLKNKDFVSLKNQMELPNIKIQQPNRDPKPVVRPIYLSLSFTPLQTYRLLTVSRREVQNLQTNNLFDSERNGYALQIGLTKPMGNTWNLRGSLSYLKMRQWAEYQINTDNIAVKNSSNYSNAATSVNNENEFIGETQVEAKTLQMIGLEADIQKFVKTTGWNRYFISAGSQVMYEPSEKRSNIFINASAGFQHIVSKDCFLTIEPTASYLLNNINDSKSLIQTNAYNLGLKVGLNFKLK
jgi:hypothetical protein